LGYFDCYKRSIAELGTRSIAKLRTRLSAELGTAPKTKARDCSVAEPWLASLEF
jgi:hypothetical protein